MQRSSYQTVAPGPRQTGDHALTEASALELGERAE